MNLIHSQFWPYSMLLVSSLITKLVLIPNVLLLKLLCTQYTGQLYKVFVLKDHVYFLVWVSLKAEPEIWT